MNQLTGTQAFKPSHRIKLEHDYPSAGGEDRTAVTQLIAASGLMLFLELALIRWLGANVVHLSYFSNFVLLGSFLGIGAGFLISRKSWSI